MSLNSNKKVIVGMSGGVDSSVAAAILKKSGYGVTGVFLMLPQCKKDSDAIKDVKKICEILNVKLKVIDARKKFKNTVIKYFLDEYKKGKTPNPCVFCNENFKFKILFEEAKKVGADYIATGHYARLCREITNSKLQIPNKSKILNSKFKTIYKLLAAKDKNKDQSYFLYSLNQKQLSRIIFPLGNYKKEKVKELAGKMKLPVLEKKESQDVCFLSGESTEEYLKKNIQSKPGEIADEKGKLLGKHSGLALYTPGQRKGINIGGTGPYYVLRKDYAKNRLIVTNDKENLSLFSDNAILGEVNWVSKEPKIPLKLLVRTRYRNPLVYATINIADRSRKRKSAADGTLIYAVKFQKPQRAVAPGQSVVFYGKGGEVLGGGIIQ